MYLLDTNILIYQIKGIARVSENIRAHADSHMCFSVVSYGELIYGACKSPNMQKKLRDAELLTELYPMVDVSSEIMECFGKTKALLERTGDIIPDSDIIIGCTARVMDFTLVTNNEKHLRRIPGLRIENWSI